MNQDEAQTLRALAAAREVMDSLIGEHGGRIANTAGDSVLAEFPSAVDAVQCAVAVQEKLAEASAGEPEDRRLQFRIGIHVGDVVVRGGDLLGDGVNIAARLEGLAEPGGIAISGAAHGHVRKALPLAYTDLGQQHVKNIDESVRVAVLPFTNMSGPEDEYFCDGMVEDIITALSKVRTFFVIARNSSFTYKGRAVNVKQVGRELGVRYVLEGSVRRAGSKLRITGQLIEAATGHHVWADRFEGGLEDIFDLQDRITESVVGAIEPSIRAAEIARARAKPTERLDAYDLYLQAIPEIHTATLEGFLRAEALLRDALARDPGYPEALSALSDCLGRLIVRASVESASARAAEACEIALKAAALGSDNGSILASAAWTVSMLGGLHRQGKEFAERALRLHPNSADVRTACGWSFIFEGEPERALEHFEVARRLSPLDPRAFITQTATASANFFLRRLEETVDWSTRVLQQKPTWVAALRYRAAALAHLERIEDANADIKQLLGLQPNCTLRWHTVFKFRHRWMSELLIEGLRRA